MPATRAGRQGWPASIGPLWLQYVTKSCLTPSRRAVARGRSLTLPSRGRPQAGFARLRPPLMSNVRPRQMRHEQRPKRSTAKQRSFSAVRPGGVREPLVRKKFRIASPQRSVCCSRSARPSTLRKSMNVENTNCTRRSNPRVNAPVLLRCASSPALRSTAAPGPQVRLGASYRSRRAASCRVAAERMLPSSATRPNPSIEGTFQSPLRALWPAPHVKR